MSTKAKINLLSEEDYLQGELHSDVRHEYMQGYVYALVGTSKRHNLIAISVLTALRVHLKPSPCKVYMSDVKVKIKDIFFYPDLLVSCSDNKLSPYYETDPVMVVEMLSPSTEAKDRFDKRVVYQCIESLREYVLVEQDKMQIDVYRRMDDGWMLESYVIGDTVAFESIGFAIPIEEIYADVVRLP
ncbi:MAG: Uma2 family endonuclease [Gammaproteobacteria bacterium]|nr:Uma2 family endonuclease [Gammaproteobacteria bacterium]